MCVCVCVSVCVCVCLSLSDERILVACPDLSLPSLGMSQGYITLKGSYLPSPPPIPPGCSHPDPLLLTRLGGQQAYRLASHLSPCAWCICHICPHVLGEAFESLSLPLRPHLDSYCFLFVPSLLQLPMHCPKIFPVICFNFTFRVLMFCCSLKKSSSWWAGALV